jgi:adenosylcobinamide-phosphate synthase
MAMTAELLLGACLLDALIGDPQWLPHPVRLIGRGVMWIETVARRVVRTSQGERLAGIGIAILVPGLAYTAGWLLIYLASQVHTMLGQTVEVVLASTTLAARDLADHASAIRRALEQSQESARTALSRIVGRDTERLAEPEIVRATVESVAESTSDGVIAPLVYLAIGGAPLALAYKAINTLDSMIGHRTPAYLNFGWAAARLDDVANWIPARATAWLLIIAAGLQTWSLQRVRFAAWMLRRDGHKHPSPNGGRPEAAMAGVLQVQLGGTNQYAGVPEERPHLGDPIRSLRRADITLAVRLMWTAYLLGLVPTIALLSL